MTITFTALTFIVSLTNVSTLPSSNITTIPAQSLTLSKDEIVHIINVEHKINQTLENFIVSVPNMNIDKTLSKTKVPSSRSISASSVKSKNLEGADE